MPLSAVTANPSFPRVQSPSIPPFCGDLWKLLTWQSIPPKAPGWYLCSWSCLPGHSTYPGCAHSPAEPVPSQGEDWRLLAACSVQPDTLGWHLGREGRTEEDDTCKKGRWERVSSALYSKGDLTDGHSGVINNKSRLRPLPQGVKIHTTIDQSLQGKEKGLRHCSVGQAAQDTATGSCSPVPGPAAVSSACWCEW